MKTDSCLIWIYNPHTRSSISQTLTAHCSSLRSIKECVLIMCQSDSISTHLLCPITSCISQTFVWASLHINRIFHMQYTSIVCFSCVWRPLDILYVFKTFCSRFSSLSPASCLRVWCSVCFFVTECGLRWPLTFTDSNRRLQVHFLATWQLKNIYLMQSNHCIANGTRNVPNSLIVIK